MSPESNAINPQNDDAAGSGKVERFSTERGEEIARPNQESMITCPVCGLLNPPGSLSCSRCATEWALTEITAHLDKAAPAPSNSRIPTGTLLAPKRTSITLDIDGIPLTVPMADVITVGRGLPFGEGQPGPDVDLSLFGASVKGVSRRHIKLTHDDLLIHVTDLDSRNGTWLNGQQILPYTRRILRNGDELQLGRLKLKVLMDPDV